MLRDLKQLEGGYSAWDYDLEVKFDHKSFSKFEIAQTH